MCANHLCLRVYVCCVRYVDVNVWFSYHMIHTRSKATPSTRTSLRTQVVDKIRVCKEICSIHHYIRDLTNTYTPTHTAISVMYEHSHKYHARSGGINCFNNIVYRVVR